MSTLFSNAFRDLRIGKSEIEGDHSKHRSHQNKSHLDVLSEKIDQLYIMNLAALELLSDLGVSKAEVMNKIEEIDLRDGKADGKVSPQTECTDCGHRVAKRRTHCFYCGSKVNQLGF